MVSKERLNNGSNERNWNYCTFVFLHVFSKTNDMLDLENIEAGIKSTRAEIASAKNKKVKEYHESCLDGLKKTYVNKLKRLEAEIKSIKAKIALTNNQNLKRFHENYLANLEEDYVKAKSATRIKELQVDNYIEKHEFLVTDLEIKQEK